MSTDAELRGKWERADEQLTILVGAAATDLLNQPPHMVALAVAKLMSERYDRETVIGHAAMAVTRLGMAEKERLTQPHQLHQGDHPPERGGGPARSGNSQADGGGPGDLA